MKFVLALLPILAAIPAFADGIPQAPTTPYYFTCEARPGASRPDYVNVDEDRPGIWIEDGGTTGSNVSPEMWELLKSRQISKMDGKSFRYTPMYNGSKSFDRVVSFKANGNDSFDMQMEELHYPKFKKIVRKCRPSKNPWR